MADVAAALDAWDERWSSREKLDEERRKTDDARYTTLSGKMDTAISRLDRHGTRTTALETKWAAFFGDNGAFKIIMQDIADLKKDGSRQNWLLAGGVAILATLTFLAPIILSWLSRK